MGIIAVTTSITLALLAAFIGEYRRLRKTIPPPPAPPPTTVPLPHISIIIPARNEANTIARCLDGALQQEYPHYEVIVLDDHSTDATPSILAAYQEAHERVKVMHGKDLPPGWVGKCYACHQAAAAASGTWLLFLDADTEPQPSLLRTLWSYATTYERDMISLFPFLEVKTFWERLILPAFYTLLRVIYPYERINAPHAQPHDVIANGQCVFVRRDAYHAIGGHEAVKQEILEDVMIARTLRAAGFRVYAAPGFDDIRVRMYTALPEIIEGLAKNGFTGCVKSGVRVMWGGPYLFGLALLPWILLGIGAGMAVQGAPLAWVVLLQALAVVGGGVWVWGTVLNRLHAVSRWYGVLWSAGMMCYGMITLYGMWRVTRQCGVAWKGRMYHGT
jgi:cellulose synthase/poly-beta-1,6-N-acetylglucosamine synthase-like glycosyltransferase